MRSIKNIITLCSLLIEHDNFKKQFKKALKYSKKLDTTIWIMATNDLNSIIFAFNENDFTKYVNSGFHSLCKCYKGNVF